VRRLFGAIETSWVMTPPVSRKKLSVAEIAAPVGLASRK
jgi:hypothetical protein